MKMFTLRSLVGALAALSLLGAGCASSVNQNVGQTTPLNPASPESIIPTSTASVPAEWKTYLHRNPTFSFGYPGDAVYSSSSKAFPQDVAFFDLGRSVTNTTAISVPTRQLHVRLVDEKSPSVKDCVYSETQSPGRLLSRLMVSGQDVCLSTESDAGAGNYYNTYNYTTKLGTKYLVLNFVVHSVNCANYDDPATKCIAFDEARDTSLFDEIVISLNTN